jgi:hypothetical protein
MSLRPGVGSPGLVLAPGAGVAVAAASCGGSGGRGDAFDVVAGDGTSCGSVAVPKSTPASGTARQPMRLDVGQDGTLLQMENVTGDRLGFGLHCALRWWSGAMR